MSTGCFSQNTDPVQQCNNVVPSGRRGRLPFPAPSAVASLKPENSMPRLKTF